MKVIRRRAAIFSFLTLIAILIANPAFAEEVGKISFISGSVDVLKPGQDSAVLVEVNTPVFIGDIVRTKIKSKVEITFLDDTVVRLAQNTRIEITNYLFDEKGARKEGILNLFRGKILSIVSRPFKVVPASTTVGPPDYQVHTPNAVAGVRGTKFFSIYEMGVTWHYIEKGLIEAFAKDNPDEIVFITRRNCVRIAPGKPLQGSCIYVPIDALKLASETSEAEDDVFTYTPPPVVPLGPLSEPWVNLDIRPDLVELSTSTGKSGDFERVPVPSDNNNDEIY